MKKTVLSLGLLLAVSLSAFAQNETGQKTVNGVEQKKSENGMEQKKMENAMKAVEKEQQVALSHAGEHLGGDWRGDALWAEREQGHLDETGEFPTADQFVHRPFAYA